MSLGIHVGVLVLLAATLTTGCGSSSGVKVATEALTLAPESLANRQIQSRRFDTKDEHSLLLAAAAVLQDMGFMVDECETSLGVIVGDKDRDATDAGQVAGAVLMAVAFGVAMPTDDIQKIRAALVTHPAHLSEGRVLLRVTFQRVVWNDRGQISKRESIVDAEIYQEFFAVLSKAVFLEAHKI